MAQKQFLSRKEFGEVTGLSPSSVDRRLRDRLVPCVKYGRRVLIPMAFVEEMKAKADEHVALQARTDVQV
jgi:hypothetical protein